MSKIICLIGISGSGKSTWAKDYVSSNPNTIRINRDSIREMLFSLGNDHKDYYGRVDLHKCEQQVNMVQDSVIRRAIIEGKDVIIDNTNLRQKYINAFKSYGVRITCVLLDEDISVCLERDKRRIRQVGSDIIVKQMSNLQKFKDNVEYEWCPPTEKIFNDPGLPSCYVFDIDGTLAHKGNRSAYDWGRVGEDTVDNNVAKIYKKLQLDSNITMIICTGRSSVCLLETEQWLSKHGIYYNKLYIRKEIDNRKDWLVKEEFWKDISKNYYILAMFDDRDQVVFRARHLNLSCFQVAYGSF